LYLFRGGVHVTNKLP